MEKNFPPIWQPGEGFALMIFRRVLTNQAWLLFSVPAVYQMIQKLCLRSFSNALTGHFFLNQTSSCHEKFLF